MKKFFKSFKQMVPASFDKDVVLSWQQSFDVLQVKLNKMTINKQRSTINLFFSYQIGMKPVGVM